MKVGLPIGYWCCAPPLLRSSAPQRVAEGFGEADGAAAAEGDDGVYVVGLGKVEDCLHVFLGDVGLGVGVGGKQLVSEEGLEVGEAAVALHGGDGDQQKALPLVSGEEGGELVECAGGEDDLLGVGSIGESGHCPNFSSE